MYQEKLLHWTFINKKKPIGIDINAIKIDTIISYFRDTLQVISCFQYFIMSFSLFFNFLINLFLMGFSPIYLGLIGKITLSSPPPSPLRSIPLARLYWRWMARNVWFQKCHIAPTTDGFIC